MYYTTRLTKVQPLVKMSFCPPCCLKCFNREETRKETDHCGVLYQKLHQKENNIDAVLPEFEKVPLQKIFEFKQPIPFMIHPPVQESRFQCCVIDQQPTFAPSPVPDSFDDPIARPVINFSLYYDFQRCTLIVHLISGSNFQGRKRQKHPNSFVLVFLIPNREQVFESKLCRKSDDPIFEDTFEFNCLSFVETRRQTLIFQVINKIKSTNVDVGVIDIPLKDADLYGMRMSATLNEDTNILSSNDSNGNILISLMYQRDYISGILLKATNLKRMNSIGGMTDPYVKINLYHKRCKVYKWKSSVKKGTLVPVYNEKFEFDIVGMDVQSVHLEVVIVDHDVVGTNDLIGAIEIGKQSDHPTGRLQWTEMISSPHSPICFWHAIPKSKTLQRFSTKRRPNDASHKLKKK